MTTSKIKDVDVVALKRTRMGISTTYIEKGTTGKGHKYKAQNGITYWVIEWRKGSVGQHPLSDIGLFRGRTA